MKKEVKLTEHNLEEEMIVMRRRFSRFVMKFLCLLFISLTYYLFVNILHFIALLSANFTDDSTGDCKGLEYTDSKLIYQKLKLTKN